jgi:hypothetical protein
MLGILERLENSIKNYLQLPIFVKSINGDLITEILDKKLKFEYEPLEFNISKPVTYHPFIFKISL